MTLPVLPQDVFDEIFSQLMDKTSTLKSCSLVCRSFRHNAQKILFRSIVVILPLVDDDHDDYRSSGPTNHLVLIVNGAPHLIEYIQHLTIDGDSISEPQDVDNDFTDLADTLGTFSRKGESFPINLQSLWLQALSWCLIHPRLQDALALLMTVPSLRDITLRGQIECPADLVQNLPPLLKDLPITSFLSLPTTRNELPKLTIPCLQHLSMRGILLDQSLSDGMQRIVDMTRLKTFDTDVYEDSMPLIEQFLRPASNSLKHLTLRFMDLTSDRDLVPIDLSRFSHLTDITINILSIPSRIFPAVILIPRMMKTISHRNVIQNLSFCLLPRLLPTAIFESAMKDSWQELDTICFIPQLAQSKSFRGITFIIDSSVFNCGPFLDILQNKLPKTREANKLHLLKDVEGRW